MAERTCEKCGCCRCVGKIAGLIGGIFQVTVDGSVLFDNKEAGRFPEIRELKEALNRLLDESEVATLKQHPKKT